MGASYSEKKLARLVIPLIMCGGAGTRLWPASRENGPKQFLPLFGRYSTFQETLRRVSDPALFGRPVVVTNARYRFLVAEQLAAIAVKADILLEPVRRDSGPAILAGAAFASRRDGDAIIVALAADHVVTDPRAFTEVCSQAREAAQDDQIVMFGMRPTRPATGYGYIRAGAAIGPGVFAIERFVEKPDAETAASYVAENYLWNSGNFMFRADFLIEEYRRFEPDSAAAVTAAVDTAASDLEFEILDPEAFARATAKSIDYAVMERTKRAAVMPVSYGWSDVGSWHTVWELSARDADGNATQGSAVFINSRGSYVATERQFVALSGLDNVVVVATDDAILVARREDGEGLRQVVKMVNSVAPTLTQDHLKVHRPWGSYKSVDQGDRFQVKRIVVKRGGRLSLQMHHHRAEHWIVVRGTARVTIGNKVSVLHENESIYVPSGAQHRLENPGKIDLELIEVQTGSYLGEDDIVRIEDDYHRS
jgi:mannose-1-phosphate guanylyltransferase/mannose-1-phosphate guanylyltransferase/mannose-6-phosphate isomerase